MNIQELLDRFDNFYDDLIESITIEYCEGVEMTVKIMVSAKDMFSEEGDGWVNVQLTVRGSRDMRFQETWRTTSVVLTDGIKINKIENLFYIEFGGRFR